MPYSFQTKRNNPSRDELFRGSTLLKGLAPSLHGLTRLTYLDTLFPRSAPECTSFSQDRASFQPLASPLCDPFRKSSLRSPLFTFVKTKSFHAQSKFLLIDRICKFLIFVNSFFRLFYGVKRFGPLNRNMASLMLTSRSSMVMRSTPRPKPP